MLDEEDKKDLFGVDTAPFSDGKMNGKYRNNWVEESVYFDNRTSKQNATSYRSNFLGNYFTVQKARLFFIVLLISFILIAFRLTYLQIIQGEKLLLSAENNRQRIIPTVAERGLIYDRNGIILTKNIPNFSLAIIPQSLPRDKKTKDLVISQLAKLTDQPAEEINNLLNEYGSYSYESIIIQDNIPYDTALSILIATAELPGIEIHRGSKRLYLPEIKTATSTPNSFSHLIGYIGKLDKEELDKLYPQGYLPSDYIGKSGIEKSYEFFLRGTYGKKRVEVDAFGKERTVLAEEPPTAGFHLELAIDQKMQSQLEKIISANLKAGNKKRAVGIVMDPRSGEILAMASLPSFDNNDFAGGITDNAYQAYVSDENLPLFNRAISGLYPSGSTIKPAIAAAALQEGIITPNTSFLSVGGFQIGNWFFPDWLLEGHGLTNVRKALAWSVNTFFYYIGGGYNEFKGLGMEKINLYLKKFGFSNLTGIDLNNEKSGFLPTKQWKEKVKKEKWYIGDTYNLSIGQGDILVTPLQIANMTVAIANGGKLLKPHLVRAVIDPVTGDRQEVNIEIIRENFIMVDNINTVKNGMRDCVVYGSCRRFSALPFSVAAKTGTAQWNSQKPNHAWFTSFAPFNKPEITVTILVEEGGEGSGISAQIAYDFYAWWWNYRKQ